MVNKFPLVSIITVVYNGEKTIEKTIQSVLNQSYKNIEYIIIDGNSTDKTVEIIQKYASEISYWVSESDNGIYNAMNKGLKVAGGEYIAILNADDYYADNATEISISQIIRTQSDYSIGNVKFVDGSIVKPIIPLKRKVYQEMPYPHVSAFISKKIYDNTGLFDETYKIAGDHDMAIRIILKDFKYCYVNSVIAMLEKGGASSGLYSNFEFFKVAIANGKNKTEAFKDLLIQLIKQFAVKVLHQRLIQKIQKIKGSRFVD